MLTSSLQVLQEERHQRVVPSEVGLPGRSRTESAASLWLRPPLL